MQKLRTDLGEAITQQHQERKESNDAMAKAVTTNRLDLETIVKEARKKFEDMTATLIQINKEGVDTKNTVQNMLQGCEKLYTDTNTLHNQCVTTFTDIQGRLSVV